MKNKQLHTIYLITCVVAACSILYELVIAHTIALLAANTVVWYSVTIGLFLGSLGVGSILYKRVMRSKQLWSNFFWVEVLLSILGASAAIIIHFGHIAYADAYANAVEAVPSAAIFFVPAMLMILAVGFMTGMELPLLFDLGNRYNSSEDDDTGIKSVTNRVLAIDYIGTLIGSLLFPLVLVTNFEVITIGLMIAVANLIIAVGVYIRFLRKDEHFSSGQFRLLTLSVLSVVYVFTAVQLEPINQYFLQHYYYYIYTSDENLSAFSSFEDFPEVERHSSPYQKIDIVEEYQQDYQTLLIDAYSSKFLDDPTYPIGYTLFLNGDWQLYTTIDELYHDYFAHVPILTAEEVPKNILVFGGGDGVLMRELLRYDEVESITHVDLDRTLVDLAREHPVLSYINDGAFDDERVENIYGDGLRFARTHDKQYDAIYVDFPYAVDYNLAKLYSTEFYHFVHELLTDDGYAVFDAVGTGSFTYPNEAGEQVIDPANEWFAYYPTLKHAGFETIIPYVVNLEEDNEDAVALLDESNIFASTSSVDPLIELDDTSDTAEARAEELAAIDEAITSFRWGSQQGFIMLRKGQKEAEEVELTYNDHGLTYDVLNEERFYRAFALPFPFPEEIDEDQVNSIVRPTLPQLPFSYVRLPY